MGIVQTNRRIAAAIILLLVLTPMLILAGLWFTLPAIDQLHQHAQSTSTKIVDRHGRLLYEIIDPRVGHHTPLALDRIPVALREATIAVEDANFYSNPGVDIAGIVRAMWINVRGGEVLAGGSTITQQLARMLLLDPEERGQRTLLRKVRESMLAWQIAQRYSKQDVLMLYLNEIYYGNLAYGAEAAARTYFGKSVGELDLAESAFLAGLPQSPILYDPYNAPEEAKRRQGVVLELMLKQQRISAEEMTTALQERLHYAPEPYPIRAPHFVSFVRRWLEERFGSDMVVEGGLIVTTTLDLGLNDAATDIIRNRLVQLEAPNDNKPAHNTNDAALVALDLHTGAVLAMVGSPNFFDAKISGAVNAAIALRQPGSAIKPVTYAAAFSNLISFTAATPIIDVRKTFPTREGLPYVPENYDQLHHGPIAVRYALATSNNVAAVSVLQQVGLERMLGLANALGIHSFRDVDSYGLALTLGGGEVRLLELAAAYATFGNSGQRVDPYAVIEVTDDRGEMLYTYQAPEHAVQVISAQVAWMITDILADNSARAAAFGENSVLRLDHPAAVKTGTTTDWRDNWTVGYTPDIVTGVWTGNANNEPMVKISGVTGAGPIWHDFMDVALKGIPANTFNRPPGMLQVTVCALSGMLPSPECPYVRSEWFIQRTEPTQIDTWFRRQKYDVATGKAADESTPPERIVERPAIALPLEARQWAIDQGWTVADPINEDSNSPGHQESTQSCTASAPQSCKVTLLQPDDGSIYRITKQLPGSVQRIPIEVRVGDAAIVRTDILVDATELVASITEPRYSGFWVLRPGDHRFTARSYLRDGTHIDSAAVIIHVIQ